MSAHNQEQFQVRRCSDPRADQTIVPGCPLVSVIVPTRNSERWLERCLSSIARQTYGSTELIVVDNNSTDQTKAIATRFGAKVLTGGPERSAQVNEGARAARGEYVYRVDSDFELEPDVIQQCIDACNQGADAVAVHNRPDTTVSWIARVREFETNMYRGDLQHSSARFLSRSLYMGLRGLNETVTAGEDYDFQNRLNDAGAVTVFIAADAIHLGEPRFLLPHLRKYFWYGADFVHYIDHNRRQASHQLSPIRRAYIRNWREFVGHPLLAARFVLYCLLKFASGGMGLLWGLTVKRAQKKTGD